MDTAVVTGASRGVGERVARRFAATGTTVVICSRDAAAIEVVADDIAADGGAATAMRADVRDEFDMERVMETAARASDAAGIDCVVANAATRHGTPGEAPISGESYAAFDDHVRTNGRGVFSTIREALPHLSEEARVLVTSCDVASATAAGAGSYAVSKAAASAVARQFAADIEHAVGVLLPGGDDDVADTDDTADTDADVGAFYLWAACEAAPDRIDGDVIDYESWRTGAET